MVGKHQEDMAPDGFESVYLWKEAGKICQYHLLVSWVEDIKGAVHL